MKIHRLWSLWWSKDLSCSIIILLLSFFGRWWRYFVQFLSRFMMQKQNPGIYRFEMQIKSSSKAKIFRRRPPSIVMMMMMMMRRYLQFAGGSTQSNIWEWSGCWLWWQYLSRTTGRFLWNAIWKVSTKIKDSFEPMPLQHLWFQNLWLHGIMVTTTTMMMMTMMMMMMVKTIGEDNDDNNGFNSRLHKTYLIELHTIFAMHCNVMMMMSTMVRLATTTTMAHLCHDLRAHRTIFAKVFTSIVSCARSFAGSFPVQRSPLRGESIIVTTGPRWCW